MMPNSLLLIIGVVFALVLLSGAVSTWTPWDVLYWIQHNIFPRTGR